MIDFLEGEWGNRAEIVVAWGTTVTFILAVISLLWNWLQGKHQQDWEEEQRLKQNTWQEEQDQKLADREAAWRREEAGRLAQWRAEDITRSDEALKPKVSVKTTIGFRMMNQRTGIGDALVLSDAINTGQVNVRFKNWGGFILPDDRRLEWPLTVEAGDPEYGADFDFRKALEPGQRGQTYMSLNRMKEALREIGLTGPVEVRSYYEDQLDQRHISDPTIVEVEAK